MADINLIVNNGTPTADDTLIASALTGKGHTVFYGDSTFAPPDTGADLNIITESGTSSSAAITGIPACLLPVMIHETALNTALLATAAATTNSTGTQFETTGDPFGLNTGFGANFTAQGSQSYYGVAATALAAGVQSVTRAPSTTHVTCMVADVGAVLTTGTATNKRAGLPLIGSRVAAFLGSSVAVDWYNGIVNWLADTGAPPGPAPDLRLALSQGGGFLLTESGIPLL
jgi:hypothetical protein